MRIPKRLSLLITLLVLILFVGYFIANRHDFKPLLHIHWLLLILIALMDLLMIAANGLFTKFIMRPFDKHISITESFYVSLISSVGNFFAPIGAGFGFRAVYLKRKHGFAYSQYIPTLAGNYIIVFFLNSLAGLSALYLLRAKADHQFWVLTVTFTAIFLFGLVLSLIKLPKLKDSDNRFRRNLKLITDGWNQIMGQRKLMLQLILITAANLALTAIVTALIIAALHLHVSFSALLLFAALSSISTFINITPANLGIKEAVYLFSATVLGFSVAQILSIALIDRGVLFIVLAIAWLAFGRRTLSGLKTKTI